MRIAHGGFVLAPLLKAEGFRLKPGDGHVVEVFLVRAALGALLREGALDAVAANGAGPVDGYGFVYRIFGTWLLAAHSAHFVGHDRPPLRVVSTDLLWHKAVLAFQRVDSCYYLRH